MRWVHQLSIHGIPTGKGKGAFLRIRLILMKRGKEFSSMSSQGCHQDNMLLDNLFESTLYKNFTIT